MFINNRVISKHGAGITDYSAILSDLYGVGQAFTYVAATDALYIGSDLPFNHRFFMLKTPNSTAAVAVTDVSVWDGGQFSSCEDVQDFTVSGGKSLAQNGLIRWALPRNIAWGRVYDGSDIAEIGLTSKGNYWARIKFNINFSFTLQYIGFRFARDADLNTYYRDLLSDRMKTAFNGGAEMLNWDVVHVCAAEEIIRDLRAQEIIWSPNQILDPETFTDAACHKLAEIAFKQLRTDTRKEDAMKDYSRAMAKKVFNVDKNQNGRLTPIEKNVSYRLRRE